MSWQGGPQGYTGQVPPETVFQYPPTGGYPQQPGYPPAGFAPPPPGFAQPGYPQQGYPQPGYPPQNQNMSGYADIERGGGGGGNFDFSEKSVRLAFIRKVYGILSVQIGISAVFIGFFTLHEPVKTWVLQNHSIFYVALIFTFVAMLAIACCESVRRTSPLNLIVLMLFTIAESFLLGVVSIQFKAEYVFYAAVITTIIVISLTIFAFQTKIDFTVMGGALFIAVIILFVFSIALMFFNIPILKLIYSVIGAFIFSLYLIYDTQLMIGGEKQYSISPEEYIFAALSLYMDIINIFIFILQIFGDKDER